MIVYCHNRKEPAVFGTSFLYVFVTNTSASFTEEAANGDLSVQTSCAGGNVGVLLTCSTRQENTHIFISTAGLDRTSEMMTKFVIISLVGNLR